MDEARRIASNFASQRQFAFGLMLSLSELPALAPISDRDARLAGKEITRYLAIFAVVVLTLCGVEGGDTIRASTPEMVPTTVGEFLYSV